MQERKQVSKVPVRRSSTRQQSTFSIPFEEVYGFRGRDASFYYLSPWVFTKWCLPGVEPGKHSVVLEPCALPAAYVTFPDDEATQELRHRAVLVRNARPLLPQPECTPMPTQRFSAEERGRMRSV